MYIYVYAYIYIYIHIYIYIYIYTGIVKADSDTFFSKGSYKAALRACGAVCHAIDQVVEGTIILKSQSKAEYLKIYHITWRLGSKDDR